MHEYGHYVQAINYPTVARGEERLRLAPTPFHTKTMIDQFVQDLATIWKDVGVDRFHLNSSNFCRTAVGNLEEDIRIPAMVAV